MPPSKSTDKVEPGQYASPKKGAKIGRLLWGIFAFLWAIIFCALGVLRADLSNPTSLIWAIVLLLLAVGSAYAGLYGITTWLEQRKK